MNERKRELLTAFFSTSQSVTWHFFVSWVRDVLSNRCTNTNWGNIVNLTVRCCCCCYVAGSGRVLSTLCRGFCCFSFFFWLLNLHILLHTWWQTGTIHRHHQQLVVSFLCSKLTYTFDLYLKHACISPARWVFEYVLFLLWLTLYNRAWCRW